MAGRSLNIVGGHLSKARRRTSPRQTPSSRAVTLVDLARATRNLAHAVRNSRAQITDAAVGSPAELDWLAHPELADGVRSLPDAYRQGAMHLLQAEDHCFALAELIRTKRSFACDPVARALAENSARAWFLLEPGVHPDERVRRLLNERLWAAQEYSAWARKLEDRDTDLAAAAAASLARLVAEIGQVGYTVVGGGRSTPFIQERRPGAGTLLERAIQQPDALGELKGHGASFYASTSAIAHGGMHGFIQRVDLSLDAAGLARGLVRGPTPAGIADTLALAPIVFGLAGVLCAEQFGRPTTPTTQARFALVKTWARAFDG